DVVDRAVAVTVNEIDHAAADAFDRGDVEFHRADLVVERLGAALEQLVIRGDSILDAERHRAGRWSVRLREARPVTVGFRIDDEVHTALTKKSDVFRTML